MFSGTGIGAPGARALSDAIVVNSALRHIDLHCMQIEDLCSWKALACCAHMDVVCSWMVIFCLHHHSPHPSFSCIVSHCVILHRSAIYCRERAWDRGCCIFGWSIGSEFDVTAHRSALYVPWTASHIWPKCLAFFLNDLFAFFLSKTGNHFIHIFEDTVLIPQIMHMFMLIRLCMWSLLEQWISESICWWGMLQTESNKKVSYWLLLRQDNVYKSC